MNYFIIFVLLSVLVKHVYPIYLILLGEAPKSVDLRANESTNLSTFQNASRVWLPLIGLFSAQDPTTYADNIEIAEINRTYKLSRSLDMQLEPAIDKLEFMVFRYKGWSMKEKLHVSPPVAIEYELRSNMVYIKTTKDEDKIDFPNLIVIYQDDIYKLSLYTEYSDETDRYNRRFRVKVRNEDKMFVNKKMKAKGWIRTWDRRIKVAKWERINMTGYNFRDYSIQFQPEYDSKLEVILEEPERLSVEQY